MIADSIPVHGHLATSFSEEHNSATLAAICPQLGPFELLTTLANQYTLSYGPCNTHNNQLYHHHPQL